MTLIPHSLATNSREADWGTKRNIETIAQCSILLGLKTNCSGITEEEETNFN